MLIFRYVNIRPLIYTKINIYIQIHITLYISSRNALFMYEAEIHLIFRYNKNVTKRTWSSLSPHIHTKPFLPSIPNLSENRPKNVNYHIFAKFKATPLRH